MLDNVQILFNFPITSSTGSNVIFQNTSNLFEQPIRYSDKLDIQLRDKYGNYIYTQSFSTFTFRLDKYKSAKFQQEEKTNRVYGLIYP